MMNNTMKGWMLPKNHPIDDREVLVLIKNPRPYARDALGQEIGVYANGHWLYKARPDNVVAPILNRVLLWRELPELPDAVEDWNHAHCV